MSLRDRSPTATSLLKRFECVVFLHWLCISSAIHMVILSAVFFFLAYHPMLSMPILTLVGVALGAVLATLLRQRG